MRTIGARPASAIVRARPASAIAIGLASLLGIYIIGRAIVEPFVIDVSDPDTYRLDWGGPSLVGVLAVHCGPGVIAAAVFAFAAVRRYRSPQRVTRE